MSRFLRFLACLTMTVFVGNAFAAGYSCDENIKYTSCNDGYWMDGGLAVGNSCNACTAVTFTDTGTTADGCTATSQTITVSIDQGTCSQNQSRSGTHDQQRTCYRTGGAGGTNGKDACTGSANCGAWTSTTDCTYTDWANTGTLYGCSCEAGSFLDGTSCPVCATGSYSGVAGAASCTACQGGLTTDGAGSTSCNSICSNTSHVKSWNTATWTNNTVSNLCSIKECEDGYELENNRCVLISVTCAAGEYLPAKSTTCAQCPLNSWCGGGTFTYSSSAQGVNTCPNGYPYADGGAGKITGCYSASKDRPWTGSQVTCDLPAGCKTVTCTNCSNPTCSYVAYSNETGDGDGTVKSGCETNNASCKQGQSAVTALATYYVSNLTCPACSTLTPVNEYTLSADGNSGPSSVCHKTCSRACTRQTCPANTKSCTHGSETTTGTQYYGGSCSAGSSTCSLTFVCADGYVKTADGTGCEPDTFTITYKSGFDAKTATQSVTFNKIFTTKPANTFTNGGNTFAGWGGSYPLADNVYTYTTADNTTLTASWSACALNQTAGACDCGTNKYPTGNGDCTSCVKSCGSETLYKLGEYDVCNSQTSNECHRACTTGDVANSATVSGTVKKAGDNDCAATACKTGYYIEGSGCNQCPSHGTCGGDDKITCEDGYTLNGKICEPNKYTVTFNANDGTGGPSAQTVTFGELMAKLTTLPTRATYSFVGYFDAQTGGTQYYYANGVATRVWDKTDSTTLYAHWSQNYVECQAGKYYDGTSHVDCPSGSYCPGTDTTLEGGAGCAISCTTLGDEYTASDVGATASSQCYKTCDAACSGEDTASCVSPIWTSSSESDCQYDMTAKVPGIQYYNSTQCIAQGDQTACPLKNFSCIARYFKDGDKCTQCKTLGDNSFTLSLARNSNGSAACYKSCRAECDKAACTVTHGTCNYKTSYITGSVFYNAPTVCAYTPQNCEMTITCDEHYELDASTGTCPGVLYTITLNDNDGTGGSGTVYQQYNTGWFSNATKADTITSVTVPTRDGWTFLGYYTTQTGGSKMIGDNGVLPVNTAFGANTMLYAHWSQNATTCQAGKQYNGTAHTECPSGSYCDGTGTSAIGVPGCVKECPAPGTSVTGATEKKNCYVACPAPGTIENGHLENVQTAQYYDETSASYPTCTYHAVCDTGYVASNDYSTSPTCIWGDGACPENYYCDPDPVACPDGGLSNAGDSDITQCYKLYDDYDGFQNGTASAICYYQTATEKYDYCQIRTVKTCGNGFWYQNPTLPDEFLCRSVLDKYYSPNPDIYQTPCPDYTNQYVHSEENAISYSQCYKQCVLSVPHATTVAAAQNTVKAISPTEYDACSFNVTCDTGYTVRNNNTATPSCEANTYTITLDKNGGTGATADTVTCVFDSGACALPTTNALSRAGYSVATQWCSTNKGGAPCYAAGQSIADNISADGTAVTLYAVWTPQVYTVKLDSRNAGTVAAPDTVYLKYATGWFKNAAATDPIIALTTLPSKAAYIFTGFYDRIEGGQQIIDANGKFGTSEAALTMATSSPATIYARLSAGTVTCTAGTYYTGAGSDCTACKTNYYCEGGTFAADSGDVGGLVKCPDNGKSSANSESATQCYKEKLTTYVSDHGRGTQTCDYDTTTSDYTANCRNRVITSCDAGYWLRDTGNNTNPDCDSVDDGYWSGASTLTQTACYGYTDGGAVHSKPNAVKVQDCYKEGVAYSATKGSGTQTCYYSVGEDSSAVYGNECYDITINQCNKGYWLADSADIDCSVADYNYYSGADEITRTLCPAGGKTRIDTAEAPEQCYKDGQPYTADHGEGYRVCFYTSGTGDNARYDSACETPTMTKCTGGYYYNVERNKMDCIVVGYGYYSTNNTERAQCKPDGTTKTETSTSSADCYTAGMTCLITNGNGTQTCHYNATDDAYTASCTTCTVTSCAEGFSQVGNECVNCPAGSVCRDGTQKTCAELTNGEYTLSDAGTTDVAMCYRNCALASNAASMSGRDYQGASDTCAIKRCVAGWRLDNGVCAECPEGSFCGNPDNPDAPDIKSCPVDWPLSAKGAQSQNDCYRKCEEYTVDGGKAVPVSDKVNYPQVCVFNGISDSGNPCNIVDGRCVETSCNGDFEMINGRCEPCNRDHALTYQKTGNCVVASCEMNYHPNGQNCEYDVQECSAPNAVSAEKRWDAKLQAFSVCAIDECEDGFHVSSNACVSDQQPCSVEHGTGIKEWDHTTNQWGKCVATYCDAGYTNDPDLVDSRDASQPCGACRNKFAVDGEIAASSYVRGCEIASCMYQGEMYNLEGNECQPICSVVGYSDKTGTEKWDATRKKCIRTCNAGYTSW